MEAVPPPPLINAGGLGSLTTGGADVVAFMYAQHQQGAMKPPLLGLDLIQLSPTTTALLAAHSLAFTNVPGLLQRALLWDSGLLSTTDAPNDLLQDGGEPVQVYTRCGSSMVDITLSDQEVGAAGCTIASCRSTSNRQTMGSTSQCSLGSGKTNSPLQAVAKCAVVQSRQRDESKLEIGTGVDVRIWSSGTLDGDWELDELQPRIVAVVASVDGMTPFAVIQLGRTAASPDDPQNEPHCQSSQSLAIPCTLIDAPPTSSEGWCLPSTSPLLNQWLEEYRETLTATAAAETTLSSVVSSDNRESTSTTIGLASPADSDRHIPDALVGTIGISVPDEAAREVGTSLTALWPTPSTIDPVAMSSDLARHYFRLRDLGSGINFELSKSVDVPEDVLERLRPFQIGFAQLSGLLQLALLWDSGYVLASDAQDEDRAMLVPVWVRCGLRMSDLALSRATFEFSGCGVSDCSTFNTTTNTTITSLRSDTSAAACSPAKLVTVTTCAADTAALGGRNVSLALPDASIWSVGPLSTSNAHVIPRATMKRHDLEHKAAPVELFTIHTHYTLDALEQQTVSGRECPRTPSLTIPCVPLELVQDQEREDWCRPVSSTLVSAWIVVEERQYRILFHLVSLGIAVILAIAVDLYFDRKPRRVRAAAAVGSVGLPSVASSALDYDPDRASSTHLSAISAMSGMSAMSSRQGDW